MKLTRFQHVHGYRFVLTFANGETREADLCDLIGKYVDAEALATARLDPEWGCIEFNGGTVDVEPKTLYYYATANQCGSNNRRQMNAGQSLL